MAYENHPEAHQPGHTVRTWTMPEYLASHPQAPVFPSISETATRAVMITLWAFIALSVIFIAMEAIGVTR